MAQHAFAQLPVAHVRLVALLGLVLFAQLVALAQSLSTSGPTVFVEGFRVSDTLTRTIAIDVRRTLARAASPNRINVISSAFIKAQRNVGAPDNIGAAWSWEDVRMVGELYQATIVIDLVARQRGDSIEIEVSRVYPPRRGPIVVLPPVKARSIAQAVQLLNHQLARDSLIVLLSRP